MAQELEMKILTDVGEFSRCLARMKQITASDGDGYVQVNYYFDTPQFSLASAHAMLRVRRKKNSLFLQYKNKRKRLGDMLLCQEEEALLSALPVTVNPARYFPKAPDVDCRLLGSLVTYRQDFLCCGTVVSLDENIYFGKTDYEIEIEGDADGIRQVADLLCPVGESKRGNGKFSRFLKAYQEYYNESLKGESL
ncbi:MAG: CYTH domain-containing protein [Clostridia bacterium]|nr:CYTH domain-containing protein [Clostridia bacterium]